jgi:hypothetical protein
LNGPYGVTGPNKKIPHRHFYVTVKRKKKKSKVLKEIEKMFKCDPEQYFELCRESKRKPKFRYLSNPTHGGRIVAVSKDNDTYGKVSNDNKDEKSWASRSSGTLTMFCRQNSNHYALTCFHVACGTDEQCFHRTFNHSLEEFVKIRKSIEGHKDFAREQLEFLYRANEIENREENENPINPYTCLGKFSKCCFDGKSDLMCIQVREGIEVDCKLKEIDLPNWSILWEELQERENCFGESEDPVKIEKYGYPSIPENMGQLVKSNYNRTCGNEYVFQDAIVVKGNSGTFLKDGDSGALICFIDKNKKKQAFAYGVCEVDQLYLEPLSSDEESDNNSESSTSCEDSSGKDSIFSDNEEISANTKATSSEEYGAVALECERKDGDKNDFDSDSVEFSDEIRGNGPFVICLKLNIGLKNLELSNAGCFKDCGGIQ